MNEILVNDFNGRCISTFFWKDKICFFPFEITSVLGYADGTKTIQDCIKKEVFEEGEEYFVLKGVELKEFKNNCTNELLKSLKKVARLLILTEIGLYGFLQYSNKEGVLGFKKWVRGKVLPSIRENGYYSVEKNQNKIKVIENMDNKSVLLHEYSKEIKNCIDLKLEKLKIANETFKMIEKILDDEEEEKKLPILNSIYEAVGIKLNLKGFDEEFLDVIQIALELGLYDEKENPNYEAVEEILKRVNIIKEEKRYVYNKYNDDSEPIVKYSRSVLDKIIEWIVENEKPILVASNRKNIFIIYK